MKFLLIFALCCGVASGQNSVTGEAKTNLATKHHKALVEKAEVLLAEKADLEARLAKIATDLEKLDRGEDIKEVTPSAISLPVWSSGSNVVCCSTLCSSICGTK